MPTRAVPTLSAIPVRILVGILGGAAIVWAAAAFPYFLRHAAISHTSMRIVEGQAFKFEQLTAQIPAIEAAENLRNCYPRAARSAAIIRLRIAEDSIPRGDGRLIDDTMQAAEQSVRRALACAPVDSFLWLALYWVELNRSGYNSAYQAHLRLSYRLGPNEGWVALKRNPLAFAIYPRLEPDLAPQAVSEFVRIVRSEFYSEAADILTGPAWRFRDVILPALENIPERQRRNFASVLVARGYEVEVPGVKIIDRTRR